MKIISTILIFCSLASFAFADEQKNCDSACAKGIYANVLLGPGYLVSHESVVNSFGERTVTIGAPSIMLGVKIGSKVSDSVAVFGAVEQYRGFAGTMWSSFNGASASGYTLPSSYSYSIYFYGAGTNITFSDNYYVSGTLGFAHSYFGFGKTQTASDLGFGVSLSVGKEWPISRSWGIGIAFLSHYSRVGDIAAPANQFYNGIMFSASYQ